MAADGARGGEKPRIVGINHVVLEVGDLEAALEFYGKVFAFELRERSDHNAFLDMGDQFIQLTVNARDGGPDTKRHFGLVVDDREGLRERLEAMGVELIGERLNFRDPWGNRIEVVPYDNIQFTKAEAVLEGMGLTSLEKTGEAIKELAEKGMAPGG